MHKRLALIALGVVLVRGVALADMPVPLTLDAALVLGLDRNAGYRIAHTDVLAMQARLRGAAAPRLPSVAVRDTVSYASPVATLTTPFGTLPFSTTTTTNVPLLTLDYRVFDGGVTAARVSQAAAELAAPRRNASAAWPRSSHLAMRTYAWHRCVIAAASERSSSCKMRNIARLRRGKR